MNHAEWLACDDPRRMLLWLEQRPQDPAPLVSNRKLRLFACACVRQWPTNHPLSKQQWAVVAAVEAMEGHGSRKEYVTIDPLLLGMPLDWVRHHVFLPIHQPEKAALLREIVGNPWRPVTVVDSEAAEVPGYGVCYLHRSCLTPTVLALAQAAYDEWGQVCRTCGGSSRVTDDTGGNIGVVKVVKHCPDCHGTGRTGDGRLDPDRLAVLADALEEAGCDNEDVLMHLRGEEQPKRKCGKCRGTGREQLPVYDSPFGSTSTDITMVGYVSIINSNCTDCGGTGTLGVTSTISPHVRGCWCLDILLGKV